MKTRIFLPLLFILLLYGLPVLASDPKQQTPTGQTVVYTAGELEQWLATLGGQGGEVILGASLTLEECLFINEEQSGPIRIYTGAYGLVYDGGRIDATGIELTGEGVDIPVLEIRSTQQDAGWFAPPDWNKLLSIMSVTATGRDGQGGVAVRVTDDSRRYTSTASYNSRGNIKSYGAGAVGLELIPENPPEVPADLSTDISAAVCLLDITVRGDHACGVAAPEGTTLFGCILTALGQDAAVAGGGIVLYTCVLSSVPEGCTVIQQSIQGRVGIEPQIAQYADFQDVSIAVDLQDPQRYRLSGGKYLDVLLDYDSGQLALLDTSILGPVDIPVALPACLQGLGLEGSDGLSFHAWIRDPGLPVIWNVRQTDHLLSFFSWHNAVLDSGAILWCSEDGGITWQDRTGWEAVTWMDGGWSEELLQIVVDQIDQPLCLALENSVGWSNIVTLTPGENTIVIIGTGGDRDGGDRGEQPGNGGGTNGTVGEGADKGTDGTKNDSLSKNTPPVSPGHLTDNPAASSEGGTRDHLQTGSLSVQSEAENGAAQTEPAGLTDHPEVAVNGNNMTSGPALSDGRSTFCDVGVVLCALVLMAAAGITVLLHRHAQKKRSTH